MSHGDFMDEDVSVIMAIAVHEADTVKAERRAHEQAVRGMR